ncbi:hypothetical protein CEXT_713531 [Caerostris extrusa]|uniref:Uncharacterized protein n=1 Tax=Caerostris extrusa TaxID=172846 RepID=A0AAV4QW51_CAEEX|nr:hypothetical protein CEXT_713531 [Caerostris extrusa]
MNFATPRLNFFVPWEIACHCRIPDSHGWKFSNSPFCGRPGNSHFRVTVGSWDGPCHVVDGYITRRDLLDVHLLSICSLVVSTKAFPCSWITYTLDMIIRSHGGLELLAIIWTLTLVACAQNGTESNINTQNSTNITEISNDNSTIIENTEEIQGQSVLEDNLNGTNDIEGLVKSQRRAARFDTPGSPWVRVYNRPPGTKSESYFNYDTRSNTSAHTSGEGWDSFRKEKQNAVAPINRRESKTKVQDILRVKPKADPTPSPKRQDVPETSPMTTQSAETSTEEPAQISTTAVPAKNDSQNKGYIIWSSNDGGPSGGWTFENPKEQTVKKIPIADEIIPKDGTHWKVVGEGGEDGWQVVDDKGDVEWKIEYDDGEWRVTSTGDIPADAEWVDPEYVWGPAEGSLSDEDEYNSWSADDYAYSPWVDPVVYVRGIGNQTWPTSDGESQIVKSSEQAPTSGQKTADAIKDFLAPKEPIRFGVRRKIPEKDTYISQENLNEIKRDTADDTKKTIDEETPQADQITPQGKSWVSTQPAIKTGQKWIQGYGTKSWEVDNTGKNSGYGGETWITANKDFPNSPWVPKTATGQIQETSKDVNTATQDVKLQDNPIRAWGTGYGSKTWKGNEWDSNVVWKTGFGGALPWTAENSTWKFPDQTNEDSQDKDKKSIVWSQPIPSEDDEPVSNSKSVNQPGKSLNNIRIKWPTKPTNAKWKTPPSRRTEDESWGDDSSEGGVIWKDQSTEPTPTDALIGESPVKPNLNINFNKGWQSSGWLNNQDVDAKPITFTWKNKPPQKTSNLISVNWKSDESVTNPPPTPAPAPVPWNQGQWPAVNQGSFPNWIFGGCKLTIKCGSSESDADEDDSIQTTPQDTSDDASAISTDAPTTTTIIKGWPVHQFKGKSWRPPPTKKAGDHLHRKVGNHQKEF